MKTMLFLQTCLCIVCFQSLLLVGDNLDCNAQSKYVSNQIANNVDRTSNDYMQTSHIPPVISYSTHLIEPSRILGAKSDLEAMPLSISSDGMSIPYTQNVSPTGALTIQIPIETFSNAAGISPNLSLSYNSQNLGMSNMGYTGWSLSVGSSISRVRQNEYYDGTAKTMKHSVEDRLSLDGVRLIMSDTQNVAECIIYEPANNLNVKVKAYVVGGDYRYFDVYYPNGTSMRLGDSTCTVSRLIYPVTKVTYHNGEQIKYKYAYSQRQIPGSIGATLSCLPRLMSIKYNEKVVKFEYKNVSMQTTYTDGFAVFSDKMLYAIVDSTSQISYTIDSINYKRQRVIQTIGKQNSIIPKETI